jgi:hypothetical protein
MLIPNCGTTFVRFGKTWERNPSIVLEPEIGSQSAFTAASWETETVRYGISRKIPAVILPSPLRISIPRSSSARSPRPRSRLISGLEAVKIMGVI